MSVNRKATLLALAFAVPAHAAPPDWPRLVQDTAPECAQALQVATAAFRSDEPNLFGPPPLPANFPATLVLGPAALDLSAGDALKADASVMEKRPIGGEDPVRHLYWQAKPAQGHRLAVAEDPVGWRGDMYSLYVVPSDTRPEALLAQVRGGGPKGRFEPLIRGNWRPPLVFKKNAGNDLWFVDVGQPFEVLADWRVHTVDAQGATRRCTVRFRPQAKDIAQLLPPPVRELASLLDQTLGKGDQEGTLQPTAQLRLDAQHAWANAVLRPWVPGGAYNTRAEVDAALKRWSHAGPSYRKVYAAILEQYPRAEEALARRYRNVYGRSEAEAKAVAAYTLDNVYRGHYVFPSEGTKGGRTEPPSPWTKP